MKTLYSTRATATGGRTGNAATEDGKVSVTLSTPKEMGGDGGPGTNPEQLFATGYSACFLGALKAVARKEGKKIPDDATVTATIGFVDREDGVGFSIAAALEAKVPGLEASEVEALMAKAHDVCPYSHAIRQAVDVKLSAA
ncbi:organic hydroperoxide resistance protein [Arsenicitalea aurantiaca]|uniref:Organic hydroperoxide resistance protein n=1 Tax=Arsenicitalea aurantiaca TaxID=1783274 RepID=A0A433X815_9HYPH|nr:organic hydroperoxide resistance protein [Arsenicitalea aurantiaca]RUT30188.1 organic hydroperoxide resistance protein [Arsenicitalea aurantiaca]